MSYFSTIFSILRKHPDDLAYHSAQADNKMHIKSILQCWKLFWNNCESFVFYPGPVLAFGYCHGLRVCGFFCLCVYQSLACPHENSSPVQARIAKFWPEVQNTLVKIPVNCFGDWLMLIFMSILKPLFLPKLSALLCIIPNETVLMNISETIAGDWSNRSSLLTTLVLP